METLKGKKSEATRCKPPVNPPPLPGWALLLDLSVVSFSTMLET